MTVLDILNKASDNAFGPLVDVLDAVWREGGPLAGKANELKVKLEAGITGADLAGVAALVTSELADVAKGHFHPRRHPSDGA